MLFAAITKYLGQTTPHRGEAYCGFCAEVQCQGLPLMDCLFADTVLECCKTLHSVQKYVCLSGSFPSSYESTRIQSCYLKLIPVQRPHL